MKYGRLEVLHLKKGENPHFNAVITQMESLGSSTKRLQDDKTTSSFVFNLFKEVIDEYPETEIWRSHTAYIVKKQEFEYTVIKAELDDKSGMKRQERRAVQKFEVKRGYSTQSSSSCLSYDKLALCRRQSGCTLTVPKYSELCFRIPNFNVCQRIFEK